MKCDVYVPWRWRIRPMGGRIHPKVQKWRISPKGHNYKMEKMKDKDQNCTCNSICGNILLEILVQLHQHSVGNTSTIPKKFCWKY